MNHTPRMVLERRYPLPEVRLRFRSTEMAVLTGAAGGEALLATAAFSNIESHLVLLSPEGDVRQIIRDANVGWAMQADEAGRLISGGWDLTCFDPATGRFDRLAERPVAPEQLWSACVTARHIVAGSSTPLGTVVVYDRQARKIVGEFSPIHPRAFYTYDIIAAPDGRILIFSSSPQAVITVLDPHSLGIEQVIPDVLGHNTGATGAKMLSRDRLFVLTDTGGVVMSYPGFAAVARVDSPPGVRMGPKTCAHAGSIVAWGANRPWQLDRNAMK